MIVFYFENYLNEASLAAFLQNVGFNGFIDGLNSFFLGIGLLGFQWPEDASTSGFSLFNAGGIIMMIIGIGFSKKLADKFGKRDVFRGALLLAALCVLAFVFYPPHLIRFGIYQPVVAWIFLWHNHPSFMGYDC
jgi:glycoside/pentoside/hexuronide:cation symporter, GPH family